MYATDRGSCQVHLIGLKKLSYAALAGLNPVSRDRDCESQRNNKGTAKECHLMTLLVGGVPFDIVSKNV